MNSVYCLYCSCVTSTRVIELCILVIKFIIMFVNTCSSDTLWLCKNLLFTSDWRFEIYSHFCRSVLLVRSCDVSGWDYSVQILLDEPPVILWWIRTALNTLLNVLVLRSDTKLHLLLLCFSPQVWLLFRISCDIISPGWENCSCVRKSPFISATKLCKTERQ